MSLKNMDNKNRWRSKTVSFAYHRKKMRKLKPPCGSLA